MNLGEVTYRSPKDTHLEVDGDREGSEGLFKRLRGTGSESWDASKEISGDLGSEDSEEGLEGGRNGEPEGIGMEKYRVKAWGSLGSSARLSWRLGRTGSGSSEKRKMQDSEQMTGGVGAGADSRVLAIRGLWWSARSLEWTLEILCGWAQDLPLGHEPFSAKTGQTYSCRFRHWNTITRIRQNTKFGWL